MAEDKKKDEIAVIEINEEFMKQDQILLLLQEYRECANEAQTLVVWALSNFDRNLRTIIFKKSIINL